jgi:hypothetical protein
MEGSVIMYEDPHLSDEDLVLAADGELPARRETQVREHLAACWTCRTRMGEIERAIANFVEMYQADSDAPLPPAAGSRALLKARLAELPPESPWKHWVNSASGPSLKVPALAGVLLLCLGLVTLYNWKPRGGGPAVSIPNSKLTPGAAVLVDQKAVCSSAIAKNRAVPVSLQRRVFREYGVANAEPRAYEVDYLITPALGGADDIRNLWPQSYSTMWNAKVKDALEDRLRDMVCDGELDLVIAQREISSDWIAAYKKYFHTETPLESGGKPGGLPY